VVEPSTMSISAGVSSVSLKSEVEAIVSKPINAGEYELVTYESIAIGHGGVHSNNPWLHELPDPISKVAWDNYIMMSPATAKDKTFDAELTGINQVDPNKRVLKVTVNGHEEFLPVVVVPGMHNQVIAIALGYGRSEKVGMAAANTGKNAYKFVTFNTNNNTFSYHNPVVMEKTADTYPVAITQTHHSYEARKIIREYTLGDLKANPAQLINDRRHELQHYVTKSWEHHGEHTDIKDPSEFDARQFELDF